MASAGFKAAADEKLQRLASKQAAFGALGPQEKANLLGELLGALREAQPSLPSMSDSAVLKMGYPSAASDEATMPWCFEQLILVDCVTNFCNRFKATLESVAKTGSCPPPKQLKKRDDGRLVADVFPLDSGDKMKPKKTWECEVWMKPGAEATQGAMLEHKPRSDSVGLVLGAGNLPSLAIMDCLHLLFQHNTVVLYKFHNLRTYQEAIARQIFQPLIVKGYFDTIQEESGLPDAQYLVSHPLLCHIHMTGSTETHDAIVWGPREGREERRAKREAVLDLKRIQVTSELGCITPYMVCPGAWTKEELEHHALHLAVCMTSNNSYYCNSPKVLVLAEGWAQGDTFLAALKAKLKTLPPVPPYYPGTHKRYEGFEAAYGQNLEKIEGPGFGTSPTYGAHVPWTLIHTSVDPSDPGQIHACESEYAFQNEPFCPVLTVCKLKGVDAPEQYLEAVPRFVNQCIWGRLSCSLIVHPSTKAACPTAVDACVAGLEYGTVVINSWSAMGYGFECGVWGAYAGGSPSLERIECVESGLGFVNNALAFDHVEKSVVTCPFIDKVNQIGGGEKLTREKTTAIVNLLINPGIKALFKLLFPSVTKFMGRLAPCM